MFNKIKEMLGKVVPANSTSEAGKLDKSDWYAVGFNTVLVMVAAGSAYALSLVPSLDFGGYDQMVVPVLVFALKALEKWAKDSKVKSED